MAVNPNAIKTFACPVASYGDVPGLTIEKVAVGKAGGVAVADVAEAVRGAETANSCRAVAVPVADNRQVVRVAVVHHDVGTPGAVGIAQEECSVAIDADGIHPIAIPVAGQGNVPRAAVRERQVGKARRIAVFEEKGAVAENADRVNAIPVPVTGNRAVACLTIEEAVVGKARRVAETLIDKAIRGPEAADRGRRRW